MPPVHSRIRIRNADDTADELSISDLPGDLYPYLKGAPEGDGTKLDPISGNMEIGAYVARLVDVETAPGVRVLTSRLTDPSTGQPAMLNRRVYWEESETLGASWDTVTAGYLTDLAFETSLVAALEVGEARKLETARKIWESMIVTRADGTERLSSFDRYSCLIGGPVRGGFGPIPDYGAWRWQVASVFGSAVRLKFISARLAPGMARHFGYSGDVIGGLLAPLTQALVEYLNARARPYFEPLQRPVAGSQGSFPGLAAHVTRVSDSADLGYMTPLDQFSAGAELPEIAPGRLLSHQQQQLQIEWEGPVPSVGEQFDLYVFPTTTSESNPLHVYGHPVDIVARIFDDVGQDHVVSSVAAVKNAIGPNLWVLLRPTQGYTMGEIVGALGGLFEFGTRPSAAGGALEFVRIREKEPAAPAVTINLSSLVDKPSPLYRIEQQSVVNFVSVTQQRFVPWSTADGGDPPPDGVASREQTRQYDNGQTFYGDEPAEYRIPGQIYYAPQGGAFALVPPFPANFDQFSESLARGLFDRFGTGAPHSGLRVLRGTDAPIADFVIVDLPPMPNGNVRGGQRIMQVIQHTRRRSRSNLVVLDAGPNAQVATTPTFTLSLDANDPRHFAIAGLSNAAALIADGSKVRVEIVTDSAGMPATAGALLDFFDPAQRTALRTPALSAGTLIWIRMQAQREGRRPSAWSAWQSITTTALAAPTGLAQLANVVSWTPTESDVPLEVFWRPAASPASANVLVETLPAGSVRRDMTGKVPAGTSITVTVRHRETAPYGGVSPDATITYTTPAAPVLPTPLGISAFNAGPVIEAVLTAPYSNYTGSPGAAHGFYGYEATANPSALPVLIRFEEEIETVPGTGVYAGATIVAEYAGKMGEPTHFVGYAPNDGRKRRGRAYAVREGATTSAPTAWSVILPWGAKWAAPTAPPNFHVMGAGGGIPSTSSQVFDDDLAHNLFAATGIDQYDKVAQIFGLAEVLSGRNGAGIGPSRASPYLEIWNTGVELLVQLVHQVVDDLAASNLNFGISNIHRKTLTANTTLTFSNARAVSQHTLIITQDATGSRTLTWPAAVRWPGGTVVQPSAGAGTRTIYEILFDGTHYFVSVFGSNYPA